MKLLGSILCSLLLATSARAGRTVTSTVQWAEADTTAVVCRLYAVDVNGDATEIAEVVLPVVTTPVTFIKCGVYTFVATAVNAAGHESEFSLPLVVRVNRNGVTTL